MTKRQLFSEPFNIISTQAELDKEMTRYTHLDPSYVTTACIEDRRRYVESHWDRYHPYAENNFLKELKTIGKFNERSWEMYLGSISLANGLKLEKKSPAGPDLKLELNGKRIWMEATAPGVGTVDPAPERPDLVPGQIYTGGGDIEVTNRSKIVRFAGAIHNKRSDYKKSLNSGLINAHDPYVIAVNGHGFSGLFTDVDFLVRRTLFASGCISYPMLPNGKLGPAGVIYQPTVTKYTAKGPVDIRTDIFTSGVCEEVSAVIFSQDHIVAHSGNGNKEGGELMLVRNPFAKNPLPIDFPVFGKECVLADGRITYIDNKTLC